MIDYDKLYLLLGLESGASLQKIEEEWKFLITGLHPDKYADGPLREKALRRAQDLNDARDKLKKWWQQNNCPPPSKFSRQSSVHSTPPPPPPKPREQEPRPRQQEPPPRNKSQQPPPRDKYQQPPPRTGSPPPQSNPAASYGPAKFKKTAVHLLYDFMDSMERNTNNNSVFIIFPCLIFIIFLPVALILRVISLLIGIPAEAWMQDAGPGFVFLILLCIWGSIFFRIWIPHYELYKVLENPYLGSVPMPPEQLVDYVRALLIKHNENSPYGRKQAPIDSDSNKRTPPKWEIQPISKDPADGSITLESLMLIKNKILEMIAAEYRVKFILKVVPSERPSHSHLCYWFEAKTPAFWTSPAAKVVCTLNKDLRKMLAEPLSRKDSSRGKN